MPTNKEEKREVFDFVGAFLAKTRKDDDAAYYRAHRKETHFFDDKDLASAVACTVKTKEER
jgi:hypothetical protein